MACFTVPAAEAIITTVAEKILKSKAKNHTVKISHEKLGWLNKMLWGGSALLAFEHVWHGEVIPTFPFLTAIKDGEAAQMLHEMATAGVCMALIVTAAWGVMVWVSNIMEKKSRDKAQTTEKLAGGLA